MTHWIKASPKREGFLKTIVREGIQSGVGASRTPILNVCITRWVENMMAGSDFVFVILFWFNFVKQSSMVHQKRILESIVVVDTRRQKQCSCTSQDY